MITASPYPDEMSTLTAAGSDPTAGRPGVQALQRRCLWFLAAVSPFVFIEPSPYEFVFLIVAVVFIGTGLRLAPAALALIAILATLNIGYMIGAVDHSDKQEVVSWIITSWYMTSTAIFFALALSEHTEERLDALMRGYRFAAVIVSLIAIVGYLSGSEQLTLYSRARGTFKDPNVLGAFLVLPALYCLQQVIDGAARKAIGNGLAFAVMSLAVLLSFSRAAWGILAVTAMVLVALNFIATTSQRKRVRIVALVLIAAVLGVAMLSLLLASDTIGNMLKERSSLIQSYDSGRFGRFGRHILGAQMALDYPFGIGPLQFNKFFPEDTHNSFLNAFMSGGWLSGATYPLLILSTLFMSLRGPFAAVPWTQTSKVLLIAYIGLASESMIIDTDHWRHFFLLIGTIWGVSIATVRFTGSTADAPVQADGALTWTAG